MATAEITTGVNAAAVPVACSLTRAGLATQARRWEELAARAMTERAQTAHGLRMSFRPDSGVEDELRTLAAAESECCPWAAWTVEADAEKIVLGVRSTGGGIATLHRMFSSLRPAPTADPPA